jgi:hypothetical protein
VNLKGVMIIIGWTPLLSVPALLEAAGLSKNDAAFIKLAAKASMTEAHLGHGAACHRKQGVSTTGHGNPALEPA